MRKIIALEWITLDGFFAGANEEIDWMVGSKEMDDHAKEVFNTADTLLFGKTTYEVLANDWTTSASDSLDKAMVDFMNKTHKIIFSKSLKKADWSNSELKREIDLEEIKQMKQQSGKDILIFGSGSIVSQFAEFRLIDEYKFLVNPVLLGNGKTLLENSKDRVKLKLLNTRTFENGNVLLHYQTGKK